ncbi:probable polygalacturonase At3g15720, partial [Prunus avium]|uniref:Probable polygalacturonase At3g15720 n=1 Tax=Prunus avium TaxID=42229 RepID=A0A6P5TDZ7_PRUAV
DLPSLISFLFLVIVASSSFGIGYGQNGTFNVLDFGALGDGVEDDSQAFLKAWQTTCGTPGDTQTLSIPPEKTYLLKPLKFEGPCQSSHVQIQIDGSIVAPSSVDEWIGSGCKSGCWLCFSNVEGLIIQGTGKIDGNGAICGFEGTSATEAAIKLDCSNSLGCTNIVMDHVELTSGLHKPLRALCNNANGKSTFTAPDAFLKAWQRVCGTEGAKQVLKIPHGRTYNLKPLKFKGPCRAGRVKIEVLGDIVAPSNLSEWNGANTDAGYASQM